MESDDTYRLVIGLFKKFYSLFPAVLFILFADLKGGTLLLVFNVL